MDERTKNLCHMGEYLTIQAAESEHFAVAALGFADCASRVMAIAELTARPEDVMRVKRISAQLKDLLRPDLNARVKTIHKGQSVQAVGGLIHTLRKSNLRFLTRTGIRRKE